MRTATRSATTPTQPGAIEAQPGPGAAGTHASLAAKVTGGSPPLTSHFERRAMGSPLRLAASGVTAAVAAAAWDAVSDEFERVEQACSRFRPTADLVRLNAQAGDPAGLCVDHRLVRALAAADRAHRRTAGRFDARVLGALEALGDIAIPLPPTDAARWTTSSSASPGRHSPSGVSQGQGWRPSGLRLDPRANQVAVEHPVDLGGIAKGLALRWARRRALDVLAHTGADVERIGLLLEAGGDVAVHGSSPQGGPWLIGVEHPGGDPEPVAVVAIALGAICTSSVRIRAWQDPDGRPAHHLVDPATGRPGGAGLLSVTVAADDPAWAEVRSKTLFLAGPRAIGEEARSLDLAAWWVDANGELGMTPRARQLTAWTR